ncbi:hypothetical protein N7526_011446 [Penicillium atrosanguineum]|nr:hypothetical protein N7526_011446 [Penicillium atrosanguineum]
MPAPTEIDSGCRSFQWWVTQQPAYDEYEEGPANFYKYKNEVRKWAAKILLLAASVAANE